MMIPMDRGRSGAASATFCGVKAHPIKNRLIAIVDGSAIIIPAVFSEAFSAAKLRNAINDPPTMNDVRS